MFSIHSREEKIDILGNFCWCEFHLFSPKWWEIRFLILKMGGRLIHKVDLYTSKYGNCVSEEVFIAIAVLQKKLCPFFVFIVCWSLAYHHKWNKTLLWCMSNALVFWYTFICWLLNHYSIKLKKDPLRLCNNFPGLNVR